MSARWRKPKCASNKAAWRTQGEARRALELILVENAQAVIPRPFTPTRAYRCGCGAWHLTSQEKREPRKREKRPQRRRSKPRPSVVRHLFVAPETLGAPAQHDPEPVFSPTDPISPQRVAHWDRMKGEAIADHLAHPYPWPRRDAA